MSDFLGHLVARSFRVEDSLADGNILRPRLPSMFERPAADAAPLPTVDSEEIVEERPAIPRRTVPAPTAKTGETATRSKEPANDPSFTPAERASAPESAARKEPRRPEVVAAPATSPREDRRQDDRALAPRTPPAILGVATERPASLSPTLVAIPPRGEHPIPSRSNVHPLPQRPRSQVKQPAAPTIQPLGSAAGQAPEPDGFGQQDASGPLVRIHIGRIEVRAVTTPPAPGRKPAPFRPKLGLDDYLRRRDEGK